MALGSHSMLPANLNVIPLAVDGVNIIYGSKSSHQLDNEQEEKSRVEIFNFQQLFIISRVPCNIFMLPMGRRFLLQKFIYALNFGWKSN